jgi:hypothetical protein
VKEKAPTVQVADMRTHVATLLTALLLAGTSACDFERDVVGPGYYAATAQAGRAATPPSSAGTGSTSMGSPAGGATGTEPRPIGAAGSPDDTGKAGTSGGGAGRAAGGPSQASPNAPTAGTLAAAMDCDLSGRWLSTLHQVTDGLGQLQYNHKFIYYEIEQSGDTFSVKKGMHCLNDTIADGDFAIMGDFSGAWPSLMRKVVYAGRTGTSAKVANGCKIDIAKLYTIYGATVPHYLDPSIPLPTAEVKATATTPGWEDWDSDGNPGITGVLSGTVTGKIFVATREWTSLSGTVPNVSSGFELPLMWDQEPNVMAFDGSPFLGSEAVRAADAKLHFAQFVRLKPDQATGDDDAICKSLRGLAPTLTPKAAGM